jgi:hypothetical protein
MKFNKTQLKSFILKEAKKLTLEEKWISEEELPLEGLEYDEVVPKQQEINLQEAKEETEKAKKLAEEIKRMKQLLDFRNPVLGETK